MKYARGFTVIELLVAIVILSILVLVGIFAWTAWTRALYKTEIETELNAISSAMDQHRNFNNSYPTSIPVSYRPGKNVKLTYKSGNSTTYCIEAVSSQDGSLNYKLSNGVIGEGTC